MKTEQLHTEILASSIFRTDGPDIDLPAAFIALADAITAEEETNWSIGEFTEASLDNLVIGAYWALTEWHGGQASDTYAAMCALGRIYEPNRASAPESPEDSEWSAYAAINRYFFDEQLARATASGDAERINNAQAALAEWVEREEAAYAAAE